MRKVFTYLLFSLTLLLGSATVLSAGDKKDDKKDKKDKGHQPVVIVIYLPAWSPVIREASLPNLVIPIEDSSTFSSSLE